MIKGVNHKVIEITDTDNIYYQRAWLLVKPEFESVEEAILRKEAKKLLSDVGTPSSIKGKRTLWYWALRIIPSVATGAGIGILLGLIL